MGTEGGMIDGTLQRAKFNERSVTVAHGVSTLKRDGSPRRSAFLVFTLSGRMGPQEGFSFFGTLCLDVCRDNRSKQRAAAELLFSERCLHSLAGPGSRFTFSLINVD